jgi:hypothetical protein
MTKKCLLVKCAIPIGKPSKYSTIVLTNLSLTMSTSEESKFLKDSLNTRWNNLDNTINTTVESVKEITDLNNLFLLFFLIRHLVA